jgi:predicted dehydrogenase
MLEKEKGIDAVVVSTPDHTHGPASVTAMQHGKHVYCEKPLAHSLYEVRLMRETAEKGKFATQMGNTGTSAAGFRQGVEVIRSDAIGAVHTVHVWTDRPGKSWRQGLDTPTDRPTPPATLDWDLWLGTAHGRPYHPVYLPHSWRGWFDFGCGALGDMGCHTANLPFMGLNLGSPSSVVAETSEPKPDCFPAWAIVTYEFPAGDGRGPVKLIWYEGGKLPPDEVLASAKLIGKGEAPAGGKPAPTRPKSGCLLIGSKGMLYSPGDYGTSYRLLPEENFADFQPPTPTLPRGTSAAPLWHYREWAEACKGGPKAMANFDYAARLTEAILLGTLAIRAGKKITWDATAMKAVGCPESEVFVRPQFRKGFGL